MKESLLIIYDMEKVWLAVSIYVVALFLCGIISRKNKFSVRKSSHLIFFGYFVLFILRKHLYLSLQNAFHSHVLFANVLR